VKCGRARLIPLGASVSGRKLASGGVALAVATALLAALVVRSGRPVPRDEISVEHAPIAYRRTASRIPTVTRIAIDPDPARVARPTTLWCVASEVDGEPNLYRWSGAFGLTEESGAARALWTPAAPGHATITCIARNGMGSSQATVDVVVTDAP
jgi:hypothetical protein